MFEGIQKQFVFFALERLRLDTNTTLSVYQQLLFSIYLPTFEHRRLILGIGVLWKLVQSDIHHRHPSFLVGFILIFLQESQGISSSFGCRSAGLIANSSLLSVPLLLCSFVSLSLSFFTS